MKNYHGKQISQMVNERTVSFPVRTILRKMKLSEDEDDTFLLERHYRVETDSEFLVILSKIIRSSMKVCSIDLNFETLSTNVEYLLHQRLGNKPYFYAALKRTLQHDQKVLYRMKRFLFTNEPNV